ncbi:MAG TPA: diguanylate cyclase [Solirubrobacteraceae bacterium]|nr:diguanylate cyclase [Solirubrobacteraceae bacterium]
MSILEPYAEEQSATERLLETSWEGRERRASERELLVEASAAALFVIAAGALLLVGGVSGLRLPVAALLVAVYAVVGRIEFPVGAGFVVPTQLILVPMLLMLPPGIVPVAVAVGLVSGTAAECALGRIPPRRILSAVPDAWHAIGPAIVLLAAGSPRIGLGQLPLLAAAFAAGCLVDLAGSTVRMRLAGVVPDLKLQMRVIGLVWAVDASLAPLGFLAATTARQGFVAILFAVPLVFLLWLLARDRSQRIDQAHRRLKLVEHERARLQTAVRRLGDAFAAKLDLTGLLEILLNGSLEALDADAGRLTLTGGGAPPLALTAGDADAVRVLERVAATPAYPIQVGEGGTWTLSLPMRVAASPRVVAGTLRFVREGRAFEEDEIALIDELISKAELSAAEIIAHQAIRREAVTDPLTGLGNRRKLATDLAAALHEPSPSRPSLLLLFDLDGFKDYNDTFGHLAGDALLARLGRKLDAAVAGVGAAYRLGGDEFCAHIRLDGLDSDAVILQASAALSESGAELSIEASLGVVLLPHEADSADHALQVADERMYANKRSRSTARSQAGEVLLRTMHAKQPELDEHSSNVAELATRVARRLGLGGEALDEIARAAELHDIGKVGIPDAILNKPSGLTAAEWEFIHQHTILGERILHGAPALRPVARLVRASHERWDGCGYPDGLRGEEIPLGARVVAVCDAYEAMTANRSYRAAVSHDLACQELVRSAGTQFDPAVVDAFLTEIENAGEERELDAAQSAAAHVRMLLSVGAPVAS